MKYSFSISDSHNHFIEIKTEINVQDIPILNLQLPAWRPGRYELGNFSKNIKDFSVVDQDGGFVEFKKSSKDCWVVSTEKLDRVYISYLYYAADLNAGATFLDENQLYVNPINCCLYNDNTIDQPCEVVLNIPSDYKTATSLTRVNEFHFKAIDFHQLVDSPFICSNSIKQYEYSSYGTTFHLCFQGEVKPNLKKLIADFKKFTDYQIERFKSFPVKEYYFLFQITPYASYHGVEHQQSTVILLGPSYAVFDEKYDSLLGISSHELYHTWNVKTIRPDHMLPYDYAKENYTDMGYVTEGVTTYMGDRILYESGVFSQKQYFKELNTLLTRHYHNDGRKHYSVAESSYDTWLDGYVSGIPGRKVSIYVEGALIALICDARIRKNTNGDFSLHDVIAQMYSGSTTLSGYNKESYQQLLEKVSGSSFQDIFDDLIYGNSDFSPYLNEAFNYYSWRFIAEVDSAVTNNFGFKAQRSSNGFKIQAVLEQSSAACSGLVLGDVIHAVNGFKLNNDLNNWLTYFKTDQLVLSIERKGVLKRLELKQPNDFQFFKYKMLTN
ncbi:MAG: M61 family metallopeptidase [Parvicellaceae bacterium]